MNSNFIDRIIAGTLPKVETFITRQQFEEYRDSGTQGVYYWADGDRICVSVINFLGKEDFRKYF
jgi:hypothetical protein